MNYELSRSQKVRRTAIIMYGSALAIICTAGIVNTAMSYNNLKGAESAASNAETFRDHGDNKAAADMDARSDYLTERSDDQRNVSAALLGITIAGVAAPLTLNVISDWRHFNKGDVNPDEITPLSADPRA